MKNCEDKVTCQICKKGMESLAAHLKVHELTSKSYRELFPGAPVVSKRISKKCSTAARENTLKQWQTKEFKDANKRAAKKRTAAASKAASERNKKNWKDLGYRRRMEKILRKNANNEELKKKTGQRSKKLWEDPKFRRKMSLTAKNTLTRMWEDPEVRKRWEHQASERLLKRLKDPNDSFNNNSKSRGKGGYYKKVWMRSGLERKFAKALDVRNIKWLYEHGRFQYIYEGLQRTYLPDFYLAEFDLYIELKPDRFVDSLTLAKVDSMRNDGYDILLVTESNWASTLRMLEGKQ